ncbi:MAG: hypothetical protein QM783_04075 [Phycisphaerales bacterium]
MSQIKMQTILAASAVIAAGAFLLAGPLNPPSGPVSAGGKTTQEIYDAVTNISGSIGSVGGRGPAVPGATRTQGTLSMTAPSSLSFTGPLLGLRIASRVPTSGGVPSGAFTFDGCTFVREAGDASSKTFRMAAQNVAITSAVAVVPAAGGTMTYTLSGARIVGHRNYNVQRSDGSFATIEEIDCTFQSLTIADSSGSFSYSPGTP